MEGSIDYHIAKLEQAEMLRQAEKARLGAIARQAEKRPSALRSLLLALLR